MREFILKDSKQYLAHTELQLTDVSYTECNNGREVEQFIQPGMHCYRRVVGGVLVDGREYGAATTTRLFASQCTG